MRFLLSPGCNVNLTPFILHIDKSFGEVSDSVEVIENFSLDFVNPIVLVEMGAITELKKDEVRSLTILLTIPNIRIVISRSSGNESFLVGNFFDYVVAVIANSCGIVFKPFTPCEVNTFFQKVSSITCTDERKKVYENLAGGNPLLLSVCVGKNELEATSNVNTRVRKYVSDLVDSSLGGSQCDVWITDSLPRSITFLCYACSRIPIPIGQMFSYVETWICAEGITYINETTKDNFTLGLNFPSAYDVLMSVLQARVKNKKVRVVNPIILGLLFEHALCNELKNFEVSYCRQQDVAPISARFGFNTTVAMSTAVNELVNGTLYRLRPRHPVIDAVGYLMEGSQPWLLLMQVSISTYSNHTSKVKDLLNPVDKSERDVESRAKNWLQYYRSRVPFNNTAEVSLKFMYIYISPREFFATGKPSETLDCSGLLGADKEFYVGLVQESSECAMCVTTTYESITHEKL